MLAQPSSLAGYVGLRSLPGPLQSKQVAATQACRRSEQNHAAVSAFQMEADSAFYLDPEPLAFFGEQYPDAQV